MASRWRIVLFIIVTGYWGVLLHPLGQIRESFALDGQPSGTEVVPHATSQEMADLDALHARNIGRLHSLYHQMKQAAKDKDTDQLTEQLHALKQALDVVESTEQDHPQWTVSWAQRHAKLLALSQDMETLVQDLKKEPHDGIKVDRMEKQLKEMKRILDLW